MGLLPDDLSPSPNATQQILADDAGATAQLLGGNRDTGATFPNLHVRPAMSDAQRQQQADNMHANVAAAFSARRSATVDSKSTIKVEGLDGLLKLGGSLLVLVFLWIVLGIVAFFMSLYCFSKTGATTGQNVIGLLLAMFLGPLYWFYYAWGGSYCTSAKLDV